MRNSIYFLKIIFNLFLIFYGNRIKQIIDLLLYREEKKDNQKSFMASWLLKGSTTLSKRKNTDANKSIDEEDEKKASKIQKKN